MSGKNKLVKAIQKNFKIIGKKFLSALNKRIIWLLRTIFLSPRRPTSQNAGFVLPTVAMVTLVVVLLTTAILFRSFERAKNASNIRVNEAVLNAATPALDRARAKLDALLEDPTLPRGTPSDNALYDALKKDKYKLGDETRLKLAYDINGNNTIDTSSDLESDETLKSAWKFAVDTDNNGKKDTFTLYGIFFRSPTRDSTTGSFNRERKPLDARTPPMDSNANQQCGSATGFASLVGNSSWYRLNSGNLGKSFFVYTVNVPITQLGSLSNTEYETFQGNKSVVALEFQQDRTRIPLANNAVWFENDLEVIVGSTTLLLNGRLHTNGNLLAGVIGSGGNITFRQVSSKTSCFYNMENGQITVGGNVGNGSLSQNNTGTSVNVDLFQGFGNGISTGTINDTNKSTGSTGGGSIGFNDAAFNQRINAMKTTAIGLCTDCNSATTGSELKTAVAASSYPTDVKTNVSNKVLATDDATTAKNILYDEIEIYLRNRTRRVPFAEVTDATGSGATTGYGSSITAITASLDPPAVWREPLNSSNQFTGATSITVNTSQLQATQPNLQKKQGTQTYLGDRVFVGNNLPALWLNGTQYVGSDAQQSIMSSGSAVNWTASGSEPPARWRSTQIQAVADLGLSDRNGFWEENATKNPVNDLDNVGGVRIVTGAGIYVDGTGTSNTASGSTGPFYGRDDYSFLPTPTSASGVTLGTDDILVWPDTMPMTKPGDTTRQGDLLMRATAVYHYKIDYGVDQEPISCVSSYYDPSDENTAKNKINKDGGYGVDTTNGRSNNGVVYNYPTAGRSTFYNTYKDRLQRQANLKFPNGRWANKPLRDAIANLKTTNSGTLPSAVPSSGLQLADYSAIDTALCAISILSSPTSFVATPSSQPAHGAIREASFLDGREVKQISTPASPTTYNFDIEQRQPLEIRTTDIDLGSLATTVISPASGTSDYLLPYSGIIYASRDDGLRDASETYTETDVSSISRSELLSPTDFKLDATRRPNSIRLINGGTLARAGTNTYNAKEKGLILVTNLPAYIKGNFNLHRTSTSSTTEIEEFTQTEPTTNFYDRSTRENRFACRPGRTGCPDATTGGDFWRPATIIADSMTLLSNSFVDGVRRFGDYDLNNNTGILVEDNFNPASVTSSSLDSTRLKRLKNGFWENNFVTSSYWTDNGQPRTAAIGSYLTNGITPIQRRVSTGSPNVPLYIMEICRKLPVSECGAGDWYVGFDSNGDGTLTAAERNIKTYQLGQAIAAAATSAGADVTTLLSNWDTQFTTTGNSKSIRERLGAGDTSSKLALQGALDKDRRYPRRVAFARDDSNNLIATATGVYKPMGIGCALDTTGSTYTGNGCTFPNVGQSIANVRGLWFRTTTSTTNPAAGATATYANDKPLFYYPPIDGSDADSDPDLDGQPLLVPVLQIHDSDQDPPNLRNEGGTQSGFRDVWIQQVPASTTVYNATFVLGNSPGRPDETSSGLQNFVRFAENWNGTDRIAKISGSFIQLKRSAFGTGPLSPLFRSNNNSGNSVDVSLFGYVLDTYPTPNESGLLPFYSPPTRKWGFDVGLLSEQPDLFAQRFTAPPTGRPNEFFREVGRDDNWVKTLLCAGQISSGSTYTNAVSSEYRPSSCPSIPND
ncbi:MAG: hormogonium polysaccharide biosynthesis protein HpsA [Nostoc sp. ChiSLP02]|nr:hormogonium polysaccharide biosynthesis protein HpsA [Nostoc sp. DedSLP05]MDZ8100350.1 hormogonium polysaccharide biosynthesis protein HpsA [Nostoc sp. DedSLP01]MDZ8188356.1 hormogonium polysaccharide biosynthesis protein HpsA [Nostoc sp. ChiSLP02]